MINNLKQHGVSTLAFAGALVVAMLTAGTYTDPTGGAFSDALDTVSSFITTTAAGPLFVLAGAVLAISVGLHWIKSKGRTAAS